MKRDDLVAFARRDWSALAEVKHEYQIARRAKLGSAVNLEVVDTLRAQVHAQRPDYPSEADRRADLEAHIVLADRLRRAPAR